MWLLPQHWLARSVEFKSEVKTLSWNRGEVSSKVTRESNTKSDIVDLYILKIYFQQFYEYIVRELIWFGRPSIFKAD